MSNAKILNDVWIVYEKHTGGWIGYDSYYEAQNDDLAQSGQEIYHYTLNGMVPFDFQKNTDEWNERLDQLQLQNERLLAALAKMRDYAANLLDELAAEDSADLAQKPADPEKPSVSC